MHSLSLSHVKITTRRFPSQQSTWTNQVACCFAGHLQQHNQMLFTYLSVSFVQVSVNNHSTQDGVTISIVKAKVKKLQEVNRIQDQVIIYLNIFTSTSISSVHPCYIQGDTNYITYLYCYLKSFLASSSSSVLQRGWFKSQQLLAVN